MNLEKIEKIHSLTLKNLKRMIEKSEANNPALLVEVLRECNDLKKDEIKELAEKQQVNDVLLDTFCQLLRSSESYRLKTVKILNLSNQQILLKKMNHRVILIFIIKIKKKHNCSY